MDAVTVIVALAVGIWCAVWVRRGSLLAVCLALLIVGRCFGKYFHTFQLGPIGVTADLGLTLLIFAGYAWQRLTGAADPKPWGRAEWVGLALLVLLVLSTFTHPWQIDRPGQYIDADRNKLMGAPYYRLVAGFVIPFALYMVARQIRITERGVRWLFAAFTGFGIYLAVTGLLEISQQWSLVFPQFIADPKLGLHYGRARGPMLQAVSYGLALGSCLFAVCMWRGLIRAPKQRWLLMSLVPLLLAGLWASKTRSVWMGTTLGLGAILMLTWHSRWKVPALVGVCALGLLASVANFESLLGFERGESAAETRRSAEMRACFSYVSWEIFCDHPLEGLGFGHFKEDKLPYLDDHSTDLYLQGIRNWSHHNSYMHMLTDNGIGAFLLFVIQLALWARNAWLLSRCATAPAWARAFGVFVLATWATYCVQMMFHELAFAPLDQAWMFIAAGMCSGLVAMLQRQAVAPALRWRPTSASSLVAAPA